MALIVLALHTTPLALCAEQALAGAEALTAEQIAGRREAAQTRLEALGPLDEQDDEKAQLRNALQEQLSELTAMEAAYRSSEDHSKLIEALPKRLLEVKAERRALEAGPPRRLPQATEQLRDEYSARLEAARARVEELMKQTAIGELRLVTIPKALAERRQALGALQEGLARPLSDRAPAPTNDLARARAEAELVDLQIKRNLAELEALKAERSWLMQRAPLQDELITVAQLRLRYLQEDLAAIKQALGEAIEEEISTLAETQAEITAKIQEALDPAEALVLELSLETLKVRRATAELRQRLQGYSTMVLGREKRNAELRQRNNRLTVLIEKYASGDVPASGLLTYYKRLEREQREYRSDPTLSRLETRLRTTNRKLFALEDRQYEFDAEVDAALKGLAARLEGEAEAEREASLQGVRNVYGEQKAALREQHQVLGALAQEVTKAKDLEEAYQAALDQGYLKALNHVFWLPDSAPLGLEVIEEMLTALVATLGPLAEFAQGLHGAFRERLLTGPYLFALGAFALLVLAWLAARLDRTLRRSGQALLARKIAQNEPPGSLAAAVATLRGAVWPVYIALVVWLAGLFLDRKAPQPGVTRALEDGLHIGLFTLFVVLAGRNLLRRNGWAQHFWSLDDQLRRYLRHTVSIVALAALLFLVPRGTAIALADEGVFAEEGLPLARLLFLSFQTVVLVLIGVVGRRGSPLMQKVLAQSRDRQGIAWRAWPLVHILVLLAVIGDIGLDVYGYSYTAATLWFRAIQSAGIVVLFYAWVAPLARRLLAKLARRAVDLASPGQPEATREAFAERLSSLAYFAAFLVLALLVLAAVLEIWGLSVLWITTLPLIPKALAKAAIIGLLVAVAYALVRVSQVVTEHFLEQRQVGARVIRTPGRKLKTLLPLWHTILKVAVIFVAGLAILEQLGVRTGPLLAGIGIFGLAVGFASQSLIKDVINGLFILLEGSLSIGDVVTLHGTSGQVEKFTLRAVTVRDLAGNVHVIPNSVIDVVTNMTKGYSRYVLDVAIAYHEDVDAVIGVLREIDEEMRGEREFARDMLEPIEILGLDRFEESAMVIRARLKTRPLEQWRIGREFQARMKKAFDRLGIEIPFPHRTLYWGVSKEQPVLELERAAQRIERSSG